MYKFIVRADHDTPRAYVIHMPGLAGTPEVMERFNTFIEWYKTVDFEKHEPDFPRVYVTVKPEDEKALLEIFGDVVAMSVAEFRESSEEAQRALV